MTRRLLAFLPYVACWIGASIPWVVIYYLLGRNPLWGVALALVPTFGLAGYHLAYLGLSRALTNREPTADPEITFTDPAPRSRLERQGPDELEDDELDDLEAEGYGPYDSEDPGLINRGRPPRDPEPYYRGQRPAVPRDLDAEDWTGERAVADAERTRATPVQRRHRLTDDRPKD